MNSLPLFPSLSANSSCDGARDPNREYTKSLSRQRQMLYSTSSERVVGGNCQGCVDPETEIVLESNLRGNPRHAIHEIPLGLSQASLHS